jgi:hypothetical protein
MTFLLEQIEEELADTEKHLEIPLQLGIALRNRKSKGQKNAFPTNVNFLPLIKGINQTMQQRLRYVFRHQDYPLLNFLAANDQRIAFNALFSYQKETYHFSDEFALHFHFEPCVADDNIIGIHLLEYGDNRFRLPKRHCVRILLENIYSFAYQKNHCTCNIPFKHKICHTSGQIRT